MTIGVISMIRDSWGGSEELWYEMAKVALTNGHKVIHLGYENPVEHRKITELKGAGLVRITRPGWIPPESTGNERLIRTGINYLRKRIEPSFSKFFSYNPDVVIYNGTCYSIAGESELLKEMQEHTPRRYYIIAHLNNENIRDIDNADAENITNAFSMCQHVFFVSNKNLEAAKRHLCSDIPNASVIRNPVNLDTISKMPFPELKMPVQLACVGNLVTVHKAQDLLLDALRQLDFKDWMLNLYGNGPDLEYLKNLVRYYQIGTKVKFHGSVSDIRKVWEINHALVLPSHYEGMPLAVVEAMLCGRVCIASKVGGISEWITDGVNGFLCEASTLGSLGNVLGKSINSFSEWAQMGSNAHDTAMKLYDPQSGATLLNRIIA